MLKRFFVDNYKCLVNFDLRFDRLNLLLGQNGSGKSSVLEALAKVCKFVVDQAKTDTVFPHSSLTRWQQSRLQRFEIEIGNEEGDYTYTLVIEHDVDRKRSRVELEELSLGGRPLFELRQGDAQLYHDDFTHGPKYPFDWSQSGVGFLQPRHDNKKLSWFRERLARTIVCQIDPFSMSAESESEEPAPGRRMENYASWYRFLSQERQNSVFDLTVKLREVLDGFRSFGLPQWGEKHRLLRLSFRPEGMAHELAYDFDEVSEGQRVLIALYTLLYAFRDQDHTLCIDEPDNFVALREIQPWLMELQETCLEGSGQALLVSHHPEVTDYLAPSCGFWLARDPEAPVRVTELAGKGEDGLQLSELIARGWEDE